jgi:hypothetical protein
MKPAWLDRLPQHFIVYACMAQKGNATGDGSLCSVRAFLYLIGTSSRLDCSTVETAERYGVTISSSEQYQLELQTMDKSVPRSFQHYCDEVLSYLS